LLEASAALSTWQASESRGDELTELARDLSEEGQRQADAAREVAALLAEPGNDERPGPAVLPRATRVRYLCHTQ
jgi:hypothetical protein